MCRAVCLQRYDYKLDHHKLETRQNSSNRSLFLIWAAQYNTWPLIKLTLRGVVFLLLFISFLFS